jgi:hypothetical protein
MMPALTRRARALWLFISAISYAATFYGFDDRLDAAEVTAPSVSATDAWPQSIDPPVESIVRRDPFIRAASSGREYSGDTPASASHPDRDPDTDVTVPDIMPTYADEIALAETSKAETQTISIRATITGTRPVAYVEVGGELDIVRVSDMVGGRRVAAIDLRGLAFTDGTRLDLSDAFSPVPVRRRLHVPNRTDTLMREFQRLRRLLLSRGTASAAAPAAASQPPSAVIVTPGPLRTVDPSGLPVGTTPTPDANSPTAYPVPYPYPPRPRSATPSENS